MTALGVVDFFLGLMKPPERSGFGKLAFRSRPPREHDRPLGCICQQSFVTQPWPGRHQGGRGKGLDSSRREDFLDQRKKLATGRKKLIKRFNSGHGAA